MTKTTVEVRSEFALAPEFRWLTRKGEKLLPREMRTSHLFNVVCMIWNHMAPRDLPRTHDFRRYTFRRSTHPPEYLRLAVREILPVLLTKTSELTVDQLERLELIRKWATTFDGSFSEIRFLT